MNFRDPIIIKLNHPAEWEEKHGHLSYYNLTQDGRGKWDNYNFEINNNTNNCNFWIVHGTVDLKQSAYCPPQNTILITSEERSQVSKYSRNYINQFGMIITSRSDIVHTNVVRTQYLCPWHVKKTYEELRVLLPQTKRSEMSAVISNKAHAFTHKKRYEFVKYLHSHFKDRLKWFGKGENFIEDKWDALIDFKYSLAIENSSHLHYWTEKIADCFLAFTMPIYWGCPNIKDYFDERAMVIIEDIADYESAIATIDKAITENRYEIGLPYIKEARERILNNYQFIPKLISVVEDNSNSFSSKQSQVTIRPASAFKNYNLFQRILRRMHYFT